MKSRVAALLSVLLVLGPVGQVLAHCCAAMSGVEPAASQHMAGDAEQAPCHGEAADAAAETSPAPQGHAHDCASALDCCGAAVSALADAPAHALIGPARAELPRVAVAAAHHSPDVLFRPPRSG